MHVFSTVHRLELEPVWDLESNWAVGGRGMSEGHSHSENPWTSLDVLSGINLGNPQSALVQARRFGLLEDDGSRHALSQVSG